VNILLINHYAGSPALGMEFRPYYLAREWVRRGHRVVVVGASFSHLRRNQPFCPGREAREEVDGIEYRWLATPPYRGNGLGRVRNIASFVLRLATRASRLAREVAPQAVVASSTYPLDILPACRIARAAGARLVFEVHDLWPLSPRILGGFPRWHPFIVTMQVAEDLAYRWADAVVSLLPAARPHMVARGMRPEKFVHIPNGVAPEEWEAPEPLPAQHGATLAQLRGQGKFLLGYAGAHGLANSLETVVEAARLAGESAHWVLVGEGPEKSKLEDLARARGVRNATFLPPVPKRSVPRLLRQFDVLTLAWRRSPLYAFGISPNKLLDYMMAGKPIIHAVEAANDPVAEAGCGVTVPPEDPQALAEAARCLVAMDEGERRAMGERGRNYVLAHHRYENLAADFEAVLRGQAPA